jgi:hypothetical protein
MDIHIQSNKTGPITHNIHKKLTQNGSEIWTNSYNFKSVRRRRGWGQGGEMTQALYAHMNNKNK